MYANEGDLQRTLNVAIRLTAYHHRWYMDSAYPSMVAHYLYKMGMVHGHAKIRYTLLSMVSERLIEADDRIFLRASSTSCRGILIMRPHLALKDQTFRSCMLAVYSLEEHHNGRNHHITYQSSVSQDSTIKPRLSKHHTTLLALAGSTRLLALKVSVD